MKLTAFTIADKQNETHLKRFVASLRKFHPEEELPLVVVDQAWLDKIKDPDKFYRMTPLIARDLLTQFDCVIKFDCDQIVTGKLNILWETKGLDVGVVLNGNPQEPPYTVWDIHPQEYLNCGLVVMNNPKMVEHWWKLCMGPHFKNYQFREQDLLNILCHYGDYNVGCFDGSDSWYGLVSKGWWQYVEKVGDELILPKSDRPWPVDGDKKIKLIHFAGGQDPNKGNYRTRFKPEVVKHLDYLTQ